jgi:hypothetical protein
MLKAEISNKRTFRFLSFLSVSIVFLVFFLCNKSDLDFLDVCVRSLPDFRVTQRDLISAGNLALFQVSTLGANKSLPPDVVFH